MLGHLGKIAEVMVNDGDRPKDGNYLYDGEGARKDRRPRGRRDAVTAAVAMPMTLDAMMSLRSTRRS